MKKVMLITDGVPARDAIAEQMNRILAYTVRPELQCNGGESSYAFDLAIPGDDTLEYKGQKIRGFTLMLIRQPN